MDDVISRQEVIKTIMGQSPEAHYPSWYTDQIKALPPAQPELIEKVAYIRGFEQGRTQGMIDVQPDSNKYEYHYDHTDCIWYRPEARNRCPVTCAQYRDGWNDAMNYIFRDGKGYRPYKRNKEYGE